MKKTGFALGLLVGTGLLIGTTAVADSDCSADTDDNGEVDVLDLLAVIDQWGTCDQDNSGGIHFEWLQTEWPYAHFPHLLPHMCASPSPGTHVQLQWKPAPQPVFNYHMQPSTLFNGPRNTLDRLRIGFTLDLSRMKNPGEGAHPYNTPTIFLLGYGNDTGDATQPVNIKAANNTWYYADGSNLPQGCVDAPTTVAELDLFEIGCAKMTGENGQQVDGGRVNVMQVTSHPSQGSSTPDQNGTYIGLAHNDITEMDNFSCNDVSDQLLQTLSNQNHLGLDIGRPFHMEYTIHNSGMDIVVTQESEDPDGDTAVSETIHFRGEPAGSNIAEFLKFQYFAIVTSINNAYGPEKWPDGSGGYCFET